ncbi:MAG: membrane dipeptidase [Candidatus Bathyarchaeia archaeon]|jgi:membrane dipeptidase
MNKSKKWDDYKSWSFLEPGVDYEQYPLESQLSRFPEYDFKLSKSQEERFQELIEKNMIIDIHEHLNVFPMEGISRPRTRVFQAYEGLAYSGLDAVISNGGLTHPGPDSSLNFLGMSQADYAHQSLVIPALKVDDVVRAHREGRVAVALSFEHLNGIGYNIDMVDLYFGLGLRACGLVYSYSNSVGTGGDEHEDGGLTDFGFDVVRRMNKLGIIVDVAHCSDLTAKDAAEGSQKPIMASHVGSRALMYNKRMLPDPVLQAIAERGGLVGVEAAGFAPRTKNHPEATIECTLDHIKYLIDLLGVDHVGGGPDTFYGDHALMYKESGESRRPRPSDSRQRRADIPPRLDFYEMRAKTPPEHPHVQGLENPGEFINIAKGLIRDGYSDGEIAKVMGLNALRMMKDCWPS